MRKPTARVPPRHLSDHLLAHGRPIVTLAEVSELTGLPPKGAADALMRLRRAHQMFSPHRGLYVAIPPQYRTWGVVPALDFIDAMMATLKRLYYVALLSAAELHGAAHQRPQVFHVMVDRQLAHRDLGRVRLRFYTRRQISSVPVTLRNSATGQVRVSTPAATALDLASRPNDAGGLSNVATVLVDLVDETGLSSDDVAPVAAMYPKASLRRLGWLLDLADVDIDTDALAAQVGNGRRPAVLLDPAGENRGHGNQRWGVVENSIVDPEL
jgi:predicted transcriptional regulator of viral defense system